MKSLCFLLVSSLVQTGLGTELQDVVGHLEKYKGRELTLVGIARVPGYFYLFANESAAARTDLAEALLVRKNQSGPIYRELDRQWVRVTGVVSSDPRHGWDTGTGLLLTRAEILRDRPPPQIKDATVFAILQNATNEPVEVELRTPSGATYEEFWLGPREADINSIHEGEAVIKSLKGPQNKPLDQREPDKTLVTGKIQFRDLLSADYEYSPQRSEKRRFYYRITQGRIERVPSSEAKNWKIVDSRSPR
jgi:hypothetical protein